MAGLLRRLKELLAGGKGTAGNILRISLAVVALLIIVFAFIWEAAYNGSHPDGTGSGAETGSTGTEADDHSPPRGRSGVQDALSGLEWVIPAFIPINKYSRPDELIVEVNAVVIHYVGNPGTTARQNRNYFASLETTGETYASSNFIVGLDGEILQCVPVDEVAYASNIRNADSVSIELCHPDETGQFTEETYASAVRLTAWLCKQFGLTSENIIRHYDVTGKECPKYFVTNETAWEEFKTDVMRSLDYVIRSGD